MTPLSLRGCVSENPDMDRLSRLPDKLVRLLASRRLSRRRVAELLEVSRTKVSDWTLGKYVPDLAEAAELARILGVSVDYLAYDELDAGDPAQAYPPVPAPRLRVGQSVPHTQVNPIPRSVVPKKTKGRRG